jgi:hypothetical protein
MTHPTFDAIGEDVAATVRAVSGVRSCAWPPPENAPAQGPACWVDVGPVGYDLGNLEIGQTTVTITVATPRKGDYPSEYRMVLTTARAIVVAFRGNIAVADEAVIVSAGVISKPVAARYGEVDPTIVACTVTLIVQTEEETVNDLVL